MKKYNQITTLKGEKKMKKIIKSVKKIISTISLAVLLTPSMVYANTSTQQLDTLIEQNIVPWVQKGGMVIGFVGALMFAAGWRNDDADSKSRGINTLISGFMIAGIATAYKSFVS